MLADIESLMDGALGQWLADQRAMREEARAKAHKRWKIGAVLAAPLLIAMIALGASGGAVATALVFAGVTIAIWGYQPIQRAQHQIKAGINSAIAQHLGLSYEARIDPPEHYALAKRYGLTPKCDRETFEDRWFGAIEGHPFDLCEAHCEELRRSGKSSRWVTVFRGAIVALGLGRDFHSTTVLQRAGKNRKWFGLGGRKQTIDCEGHALRYVDQVHPAFEEVFEIYSDDAVEAREIVHPAYVERLLRIEAAFKGKAIRALFAGGRAIIAVESGRLFESGAIDPERDRELAQQTARQFETLARLALSFDEHAPTIAASGRAL